MHVRQLKATGYRRFTDLTVELEGTPKLVVLCGPNGTGKSSLFDAFRTWQDFNGGAGTQGAYNEADYLAKGTPPAAGFSAGQQVQLTFREDQGGVDPQERLYIRSAYRNEPEFALNGIQRAGSLFDAPRARRLIDNDVRVSDNYQRLISQTLDGLYGGGHDEDNVRELREAFIGELRDAFSEIFPDLVLEGPGDPLSGGTFRFRKGMVSGFPYKNLSGGEKAVFDLLLDLMVKRASYTNTVFCIDEPEAHSNTRVQGAILDGLLSFINESSQLWVATHSIGMMRRARELQEQDAGAVAFLDFQDLDFDQPVTLAPVTVDRDFWGRTLGVALGDLASLMAPAQVVLCEGKPADGNTARAEFDARCYRNIFGGDMPDTDFISVGNEREVQTDQLQLGRSIQALVAGTTVVQVVDRDHRSPQEVTDLQDSGVRVLRRRHLESYLLDDEVLEALCVAAGKPELVPDILAAKVQKHAASVGRGNDPDDWKSPASQIAVECRRKLALQGAGNSTDAFLADTMAPLIRSDMTTYEQLREDLFG